MNADAVAIASLILTAIGAVAACIAAYFSWKAPSKEDLARVERNTAESSLHQKKQSHREELAARAQAVPIVVTGENHPSEHLTLLLTIHERHAPLTLTRVGLYNENGSFFGTVECTPTSYAHQFEAEIAPNMFQDWFQGRRGTASEDGQLQLRVYMTIDAHEAYRDISVKLFHGHIVRGNTSLYLNKVEGWV